MAQQDKPEKQQRSAFELYLDDDLQQDQLLDHSQELRPQDLCPKCQQGHLDYDGLLNLCCDQCGFILTGCFT